MKIIKSQAKEIFTKTKLPGCDYVINQYVGCGHKCAYCYARFISKWKGYGDWGSWVEAKMNAPELVKNRYITGLVFMSSISDAYQPIERKLKLTRAVLGNMDKNIQLSILTKSDLALRDIDLFKQFKNIEIGFTINSFTGEAKKFLEPFSPTFEARVNALKILKENGIKTYAFVSPIIPELIDLDEVINSVKSFVDYFWFEFINMRGAGKEFKELLAKKFPSSYKIVSDKKLMEEFISESKQLIKKHRIKIQGIEKH